MKYKIAVTSRIVDTKEYHEIRDVISHDLTKYLEEQNALPIVIPNNINIADQYLRDIDLLLLSGGNNVSTAPDISQNDFHFSSLRDSVESKLVEKAIRNEIPILGICRGMQFLNCYFGGKLKHLPNPNVHSSGNHKIDILKESIFFRETGNVKINSYHNFVISVMAENLEYLAKADDNTVEAFKHVNLPIYGLMWHPERSSPNNSIDLVHRNIFERIIKNQ